MEEILSLMPPLLRAEIHSALEQRADIHEIRLRKGKPIVLCAADKTFFIRNGQPVQVYEPSVAVADTETVETVFAALSHYSLYTYQDNLNEGFITLKGGGRVGVCATAVVKNGVVCSVKDISALNFRVARQVHDTAAMPILERLYARDLPSTVIIGAPMSGKTTLLREICKVLSSGFHGRYYKCCVIDERGEIAAMHGGTAEFDVGINTDVLSFFPKKQGILNAVRTLAPDVIIADELGDKSECESILQGFHSGVKFFLSMHAVDMEDARKKEQFRVLEQSGNFGAAVCLENGGEPGSVKEWHFL